MNTADPSGDSTGTRAVIARHRRLGALASLPAFALAALFLSFLPAISGGETLRYVHDWIPSLGIRLSFYIDGLSLIFAILITGIGGLVTLYSSSYLAGHTHYGRFSLYLFLFMLSMIGLVLADNLITLFVFWELTTITSYLLIGFDHTSLLIGFDHTSPKARRNALQALFITGGGGLALLAGLIMMGSAAGTFELSEIVAAGDTIRIHEHYTPILILVLIGAFTKSAQVPFHFWLPNAMAAPTPVSAYLHSATMVKAGIYLLARMHPVLSGTDAWIWTLTIFGAVTAVTASILALRQTDLKMALAYTTVMALGTLTMFLGAEATVAIAAAITFLVVHSLYKASLFMIVGIIDHGTGTREATQLRGLSAAMPITAIAAGASALSMAGFPPFLGFIGKELKYEGALAIASEPVLVASAAIFANALMVAVAAIVALRPFYGRPLETPKKPHEAPIAMWIGPLLLGGLGLTFGLAPSLVADTFVQPAVSSVLGRPELIKLSLWHGINIPLMLSLLTFALGIAFYLWHGRLRRALIAAEARLPTNADRIWDQALDGLKSVAGFQTRILQNGSLRRYIFVVYATFSVAAGATLVWADAIRISAEFPDLLIKEWSIVALIAAGAVMTVVSRSRLTAICALGVVGLGVALVFVMFGAPDVAITQLLVETLVVVLVAVIMLRLPTLQAATRRPGRWRDTVLAVSVGGVTTLTLLAVVEGPINRSVTAFFETASMPEAFGRNIVNVILVDFRALDTFGEVAVVAIAALAAYALIRRTTERDAP